MLGWDAAAYAYRIDGATGHHDGRGFLESYGRLAGAGRRPWPRLFEAPPAGTHGPILCSESMSEYDAFYLVLAISAGAVLSWVLVLIWRR